MSTGSHVKYVVSIFVKEDKDYSEEIKLAVNERLIGKGHATKVEKEKEE